MQRITRTATWALAALLKVALAGTLIASLLPAVALAQHDHEAHGAGSVTQESLGTVDFLTSCKPAVRDEFNRGVALLHSFWFPQSRTAFEKVLSGDADCAIAYWGIALTHWGNPFSGLRVPTTIALGKAAIDKGQATGSPSPREHGYIDAVAILFSDANAGSQRTRVLNYESAMGIVAAENPTDVEATIFSALSIAQAAQPEDKTFARQLQAGALLEPLFAQMPHHPGLAHYLIHSYDAPPLASKALAAARAYADIAPAVPHALHMPSHTFTRVGLWQESVATNIRSADTAEQAREPAAILHALDYMTYAYLQMGMDAQAAATLERARHVDKDYADAAQANSFAVAAIPARYALERQQWQDAAQVAVAVSPAAPYIEAMSRFTRAVGAARTGNLTAVQPEIDRLTALRERELEMKDTYWAGIVDIQRRGAAAWLLFAQGDQRAGIEAMRGAADAEDATDKSAVTPGPLAPAREMLGYMLLESGNAGDALKAFDAVIAKEPNRFLALYGAGQAAEKARQKSRAKRYYKTIVTICKEARADRPQLIYARKMAG